MLIVTSSCLLQNKDEPPSMIVAGSATWSIKDSNASVHALQEYSWNLTRLVQVTSAFVFGFMSEVVNIYEVFCILPYPASFLVQALVESTMCILT